MSGVEQYMQAAYAHSHEVNPDEKTGCWLWSGCMTKKGYGMIAVNAPGRRPFGTSAHRVFFIALKGYVPHNLVLDHLCGAKSCVNPEHLEPVTAGENVRRAQAGVLEVRATHCNRGHEVGPENTYYTKDGRRECRACARPRKNEWQRIRRAELRAASDRDRRYWKQEEIGA
jgi:hypothetical protein